MPMSTSDARGIGGISGATDPMTSHSSPTTAARNGRPRMLIPVGPPSRSAQDSSTSHAQLCRNSGEPSVSQLKRSTGGIAPLSTMTRP